MVVMLQRMNMRPINRWALDSESHLALTAAKG